MILGMDQLTGNNTGSGKALGPVLVRKVPTLMGRRGDGSLPWSSQEVSTRDGDLEPQGKGGIMMTSGGCVCMTTD